MKHYINPILRALTVAILLYTIYQQDTVKQEQQKVIKEITAQLDSLKAEESMKDIQIGRYEIILERLEEELPHECKTQVDNILNTVE